MMTKMFNAFLAMLFLGIFSFPALAQYETKDSFYFMKDDGIFSPEEKDEEAEYIRRKCEIGSLKPQYYDCSCIAGAFRIRRDEEKLIPQDTLVNNLFSDETSQCADPLRIAGNTFKSCIGYGKFFRARKGNNEEYCKCVANKVSNEFTKKPRLRSYYIRKIKLKAMSSCDIETQQPQN